jgi:aminopeptidase N
MRHSPLAILALAAALGALTVAACSPSAPQKSEPQAPAAQPASFAPDPHSYASPAEARVTHVDLDLATDFASKTLSGTATLDVTARPDAKHLVLDTNGLDIRTVTDQDGRKLAWSVGAAKPVLGQPLDVAIDPTVKKVKVVYRTRPTAGALQWLTPEQTAGKKRPYLFSQGQALLTRSWIPTQDSPGIRQTYTARIVTPADLRAVMSAESLTTDGEPVTPAAAGAASSQKAWRFRMDKPIAPYLIALAVGDIAFKPLGPRTGVYTEPAMLDAAANELVDVEKMVTTAEKLYGPYRWGRYDLLVLPPAFPYGGMENPRLTFATPTILAGDRSLVALVAHELAHSWSGNLVTNANWSDFWVNEGFTTYFENRIMEALYGPDRAAMLADLSWQDMEAAVKDMDGGWNSPDTRLHLDLTGRDPDQIDTTMAYEKGSVFLRTVEHTVGRKRFDAWLRSYFDRHAFQPMTSDQMLADMRANLIKGDKRLEEKLQLDRWVYQPGLPENAYHWRSKAFSAVETQAKAFAGGAPAKSLKTAKWTTQEWQHFLGALPETLPPEKLADLDQTFGLSNKGNSEILFAWLRVAVRNHYDPAVPALEKFLLGQGRRKFVLPLFQDLRAQGDWGRPIADRLYAQARPLYHPVTGNSVDAAMKK